MPGFTCRNSLQITGAPSSPSSGRKISDVFDCSPLSTRAVTFVAGRCSGEASAMPMKPFCASPTSPPTVTHEYSAAVKASSVVASAHT